MGKAPFIVIAGTDGSGKGTQTELLVQALEEKGVAVRTLDFPQYEKPSAYFVEQYLNGRYGSQAEVGPKRACIFYSVDRFDAAFGKDGFAKDQEDGKWIVSNRYVTANMGHQASAAPTAELRNEMITFIDDFEYNLMGLPREDLVILLYMPPIIGQRLVGHKAKRSYTDLTHDIHEADDQHMKKAAQTYLYLAKTRGWTLISCTTRESFTEEEQRTLPIEELVLTKQQIHEKALEAISEKYPIE